MDAARRHAFDDAVRQALDSELDELARLSFAVGELQRQVGEVGRNGERPSPELRSSAGGSRSYV